MDSSKSEIDLKSWERMLQEFSSKGPARRLVVGGTGHLVLSASEEAMATAHLLGHVLPRIAQMPPANRVVLVTGAAPGSDRLLMQTAGNWFLNNGIEFSAVALLPVPIEWLVKDWIQRCELAGHPASDAARRGSRASIDRMLAEAQWRVALYDPEDPNLQAQANSVQWRVQQYRTLAACLALQSDVLVAVLRENEIGAPGGTAEVVQWRKDPRQIPLELIRSMHPGPDQGDSRRLILIDPRQPLAPSSGPSEVADTPMEIATVIELAEVSMQEGNDLRCHDLISDALRRGFQSRRMDYLGLVSLANVGGSRMALERYRELNLRAEELDEDWMALLGRLEKDLALDGGEDARDRFRHSANAYAEAFARWHRPYSGINAATMSLMAGEVDVARGLALAVLKALAVENPIDELDRYYHAVTGAEAALHLGNIAQTQDRLRAADDCCVDDFRRRGRTLQQLRFLCARLSIDPTVLAPLRLPPVVLVRRPRPSSGRTGEPHSDAVLNEHIPQHSLVFMPLLGPEDLEIAEVLLARGARLYLTLAQTSWEARIAWNQRWGEAPGTRLDRVLSAAQRISVVPGFLDYEAAWCAHHAGCTALGASLTTARRLGCQWRSVWLERQFDTLACWPASGDEIAEPPAVADDRRMVGIVFADIAGFAQIPDSELPHFWKDVMGTMSARLRDYGDRVLHAASWGDALHVVTVDARSAADIALDLVRTRESRRGAGPQSPLGLRVAAHFAPAFEGMDPIRGNTVFYGTQVSFAARIEPVTPPGTVFGSSALVAQLTLEAPDRFRTEYAGELELAKKMGVHPLFSIQRRATG